MYAHYFSLHGCVQLTEQQIRLQQERQKNRERAQRLLNFVCRTVDEDVHNPNSHVMHFSPSPSKSTSTGGWEESPGRSASRNHRHHESQQPQKISPMKGGHSHHPSPPSGVCCVPPPSSGCTLWDIHVRPGVLEKEICLLNLF